MNTTHDRIHRVHPLDRRPQRCLRHRVWMAACDDCLAAHAELLRATGEAAATPG
ncbi:hypothetical protein OF117_01695 [Geodermatophilus sp. YIM 151500]|uniref:hypothetical protein n=1 Tax=Geodermatophilus sp. YIM 151500 TaxID=2984531 RepID=UPI0021E41809|nr:hypothetical protein [Geodermatophilus sp. YIM 151500]MCV2488063.1 hypothetical protein [Geodermatophilus sp. YIM 151500]